MSELNEEVRFGKVAIDKGFTTQKQVIDAIEIQVKENIEFGTHRKIGMILLERGHITLEQIDEVLKVLDKRMR